MFFVMPFETFITIFILISWFITISFILIYAIIFSRISYVVSSKKQRFKIYSIYVVFCIFLIWLFCLRWLRKDFSINIPKYYAAIENVILQIKPQDLIILILLGIIVLIFWLLLTINFYQILKKYAVELFVYYYQFSKFRNFFSFFLGTRTDFKLFLLRRVLLFTENPKILSLTLKIWPRYLKILESVIFFCLLPCLLVFDLYFNNYTVVKIFVVFPWFFLYSLLRTFYRLLGSLYSDNNINLTYKLYGFK